MIDTTMLGPTPSVGLDTFQAIENMDYHTMPWTNGTGSDVSTGDIVVVDGVVGAAIGPIPAGKSGTLVLLTVINVVKKYEAIAQGAAVYWDETGNPYGGTAGTGAATGTATGAYFMGRAIALAAIGDARVRVLMIPNSNGMTAFTAVTIGDVISGGIEQGTRTQSLTQNYPLGTKRVYSDGRIFRYAKARTALHTEFGACYAAKTITNAVAPVQASGAGTAGQSKVTITVASGDGLAGDGVIERVVFRTFTTPLLQFSMPRSCRCRSPNLPDWWPPCRPNSPGFTIWPDFWLKPPRQKIANPR